MMAPNGSRRRFPGPRILGAAFLFALVIVALALFLWPTGPVGYAGYQRIENGMPRDEVVRIIRLPPGQYNTDYYTTVTREQDGEMTGERMSWIGDAGMIEVVLNDQGRVIGKQYCRFETAKSWPARARRWWFSVRQAVR